jgi:uncharacterized membrane protein SpoIIM required for sporulation
MSVYPPNQIPQTRNSTMAIVSLISGIAGWSLLPFLGSIVAIITGHIAQGEIKKSGGMITGKGMATAGLILGYLSVALGLCALCLTIILPLFGLSLLDWSSFTTY